MDESIQEAVCFENEVFFGPVTDKEKKIREEFESKCKNKPCMETNKILDNEISHNDSLYVSFSETKYDSFEDSLNVEVTGRPEGLKPIALRKSFDKLKSKNHGFYDSLEDICSLVSNMDKCSISCDVETNFTDMHNIEDSKVIINDNHSPSEQVHFDDDSLAILELESTFDDSLEEFNIQSIEIEEINNKEGIIADTLNISSTTEQKSLYITKNLFDTSSVEVIYEKRANFNIADETSSSDEKKLIDSLSNSDFKDILKDSLEESQNYNSDMNSKNINSPNSGIPDAVQVMSLDNSVQIIYEKIGNISNIQTMTVSNISNSEGTDLSKDSLENLKNENVITIQSLHKVTDGSTEIILPPGNNFAQHIDNFKGKELSSNNYFNDSRENILDFIQDSKSTKDSISTTFIPTSSKENANTQNETESENSCLKFSNDKPKLNEDLNLQSPRGKTSSSRHCQLPSLSTKVKLSESVNYKCEVDSLSKNTAEFDNEASFVEQEANFQHTSSEDVRLESLKDITEDHCQLSLSDSKLLPDRDVTDECKSIPFSKNVVVLENIDNVHIIERKTNNPNINLENALCEVNENIAEIYSKNNESNITQRKSKFQNKENKKFSTDRMNNTKLIQALDLHDISLSFFNESFVQSEDSLMSLNLCMKKQSFEIPVSINEGTESKENMPQLNLTPLKNSNKDSPSKHKGSSHKIRDAKSPKKMKNNSKVTPSKRTPGTKIPVRKIDNFAVTTTSPQIKHIPKVASAEKVKKSPITPYINEFGKNTPDVTPNKVHYCKVRNTIFSKVPQITPSKKFMNIKSPIAQYIRSTHSYATMKTPAVDPVLRDCMNDIHMQQQLETPNQVHHYPIPRSAPVKTTKRKA